MEKQQKITHKRFQIDKSEGSIEVQFDFVLEDGVVKISNIHIHGNFDSGLPSSPTFEQVNNTAFLVSHYTNIFEKRIMERVVGNKYADEIVEAILKLKDELKSSLSDIE
jgi:hypothetical protein